MSVKTKTLNLSSGKKHWPAINFDMHLPKFLNSVSRKFLWILFGIVVAVGIIFFIWEQNKYRIVNNKIADTVAQQTDSLYLVKYDSLHFDEITGQAYLKNIHIGPDASVVKERSIEDLPYVLLDIKIASLKVTGVKTDKALIGQQMIGDSVVIENPEVTLYFVKPLQKQTNINKEAKTVYDEILGNLNRIQAGHVFLNNIRVSASNFYSKEKAFDLTNGNIQLFDVLIDSSHNLDTTRTLFCKQAAVEVNSFISYNNNRPEITVNKMIFSGKDNLLSFNSIEVNRFVNDSSDAIKLLNANGLTFSGIDADQIVKNKNIAIDNISCRHIILYELPLESLKSHPGKNNKSEDTTGFAHVYSIYMKHLDFPEVEYISKAKSNYTLGNIFIKINEVKADQIINVTKYPMDFSNEVKLGCDKISMTSNDRNYNFLFQDLMINSLKKELNLGTFIIKPFLGKKQFANKAHFQKDRYDVTLKGISLKGIDMGNLVDKKIFASGLTINSTSAKIYRDLTKPLNGKSKVGNYPSQLIKKLDIPINIAHASLSGAFIQYTEHEKISDSSGVVTFTNTNINISNITNANEEIQKNNAMTISFDTKVLNEIPLKGDFKFFLNSGNGAFEVNGHVPSFDALILNKVSVPMALMRLNTGKIDAIDFDFTGNDSSAKGHFVMKYSDLKVDVLKRDKDSKEIKKKGITSLLANIVVKNNNPNNGDLRKEDPEYERNIQKSFFNLVWKTIFTGMKKTVGVP